MRIKNNYIIDVCVLLAGMIVAGLLSVAMGKELNWDLASYHFYNPFALLHQRANQDSWPLEFLHVHLTPTADFLTYYFITYLQPKTAVFLLGALHGINLWLLYAIALNLLTEIPPVRHKRWLAIIVALLGVYGPTVLPGLGSFQHDALVSIFILGFVWMFLCAYQRNFSSRWVMGAGFLLGVSVGLKLTAGIFALSAVIAIAVVNVTFKQKVRILFFMSAGALAGVLLTAGYWFAWQWQHYHNPVYPFLNGLFHSPNFPSYSWKDARFMPANWMQAILFPFYFSFDGRTNDVPFRDFRFSVMYVLLLIAIAKRIVLPAREKWLLIFFVVAYIVWECGFSIMRYAMPLEMLAPLAIFLLLNALCQQAVVRDGWLFAFIVLTVMGMYPAKAVRAPWYGHQYFNVKIPASLSHTSSALVLMPVSAYALALKPRPQTYLIAYLPQHWRYLGVPFQHDQSSLSAQVTASIQAFTGQIYILASSEYMPLMTAAVRKLDLVPSGACDFITSDRQEISHEDVGVCPFKKLSSPTDQV